MNNEIDIHAPLFHEIDALQFSAMKALGMSFGELVKNYRQPEWCAYPGALEGLSGCWSLVYRHIRCRGDCGDCDLADRPDGIP